MKKIVIAAVAFAVWAVPANACNYLKNPYCDIMDWPYAA